MAVSSSAGFACTWIAYRKPLSHLLSYSSLPRYSHCATQPLAASTAGALPPATLSRPLPPLTIATTPTRSARGRADTSQLRALRPILAKPDAHPSLPLLASVLEEFRDDELEHLDTAVEEGALKAPGHSLLSAAVGAACRIGIAVAQKV